MDTKCLDRLTKADFAKERPFAEVFPDPRASIRKGQGSNKAPTRKLVWLRLSWKVIEHFKSTGARWQLRICEVAHIGSWNLWYLLFAGA